MGHAGCSRVELSAKSKKSRQGKANWQSSIAFGIETEGDNNLFPS